MAKPEQEWISFHSPVLIKALANENFFHKDYEKTLLPVYGDTIDAEKLVVEGGEVQ